ncbi:hypothetical protein KR222_003105 [Zaprionus bogoriensis]|nr:hypothetical protein KR222_003105 [Zaprionus bogoriensis]
MAFVARRNTDGKLVDCQVISGHGHGTSTALGPMSDQSDEDNDLGSMHGYSNRSYTSPTVRYVANKGDEEEEEEQEGEEEEDSELDSCYKYKNTVNSGLEDLDDPEDATDKYSDQDEEELEEQESVQCALPKQQQEQERDYGSVDTMSMNSVDGATICSPNVEQKLLQDDGMSLASLDVETVCQLGVQEDMQSMMSLDVATVCQPVQSEDSLSRCSNDVSTVCRPVAGGESKMDNCDDTLSLDSNYGVSVMRPDKQGIMLDNLDSISSNTFDCQSQVTSRTYNVKSSTVRRDDCSSASTCSWTDMYGGALKQSESRSNIVPSLSLNLSTTSSSGSSTYFRTFDDKKERQGQAAYQEWMKRKERQQQQKQQAAKEEREKRDAETAMRQRLAKERYQEWCRQKELQQQKKLTLKSSVSSASCNSHSSVSSIKTNASHKRLVRKESSDAAKKRREEWERIKLVQQQRDRERQRVLQITQQQMEKQRREKSEGAWKNWMKSVGKRAKPVPLNQGFDTLRGTIANIYVNPNRWVSNIDPNDSRGN